MRKAYTLLFALFLVLPLLQAQQLPLATQYIDNQMLLNPAATQIDYLLSNKFYTFSAGASYRRQWSRRENAPQTGMFRLESIFQPKEGKGIGLITGGYAMYDQSGPLSFTSFYARIAGAISFDPRGNSGLNFGLSLGAIQYRLKVSEVRFLEPDPLEDIDQTQMTPDVGVGVFYHQQFGKNADILYAGFSAPQLFALTLTGRDDNDEFFVDEVAHYYGTVGFIKSLYDVGSLQPHIWLKYTPNAPLNVDFNLRYQINQNFWFGAGAGTSGQMHLETGLAMEEWISDAFSFKIGYGTDFFLNAERSPFGMTHEINLTAVFGRRR